ncbi:DUF4291 family protein [Plantactinospora sp. WMMB334]|uniref:DUF4291 family protein n=1 Tax=Plantactinospora sp. WMMB334 TaxID=3404119 RepID=UPI003B95391D
MPASNATTTRRPCSASSTTGTRVRRSRWCGGGEVGWRSPGAAATDSSGALGHAGLGHHDRGFHPSRPEWAERLKASPVCVQWDAERALERHPLPYRSLQVGLSGPAVTRAGGGPGRVRRPASTQARPARRQGGRPVGRGWPERRGSGKPVDAAATRREASRS